MTELEKIFYCDRLYAYAMQSLKKNQNVLKCCYGSVVFLTFNF